MKPNQFTIIMFILIVNAIVFASQDSTSKKRSRFDELGSLPDSTHGYSWEKVAKDQSLLSDIDIQKLKANNLLVTNDAFRQVFDPYISTDVPVFITSDAVLFAYHVLLEESMMRLENINSQKLVKILQAVWDSLPVQVTKLSDKKLENDAKLRGQIIIGTALELLGTKVNTSNTSLLKTISEEVDKITKVSLIQKPKWLGIPDSGFVAIDYSRFKPRGIYTRSPELVRYFRAVSWLQAIPFRIDKDDELVSILILGSAFYSIQDEYTKHGFRNGGNPLPDYAEFIGAADAWNLEKAGQTIQGNLRLFRDSDIVVMRKRLLSSATEIYNYKTRSDDIFQINDQIRFHPTTSNGKPEPHFRIISAFQSPDAILFQHLENANLPITSLSVPAFFEKQLIRQLYDSLSSKPTSQVLDSCSKFFKGESIYSKYLDVLKTLISPPEPDAPSFMANRAWRIKSLNSFLSGFALFKHATILQAKENEEYLGASLIPPGFVEPNPEFWGQFGRLCLETDEYFDKRGIFSNDFVEMKETIAKGISLLDSSDYVKCLLYNKCDKLSTFNYNNSKFIRDLTMVDWWKNEIKGGDVAVIDSLRKVLNETLHSIEIKNISDDLRAEMDSKYKELHDEWKHLAEVSKEIEMLAHKQLRKRPFTEDEEKFFKEFGENLGNIMQYGGNSYLTPRDDSPRIVDICTSPSDGNYLEIGTCRPRALYVLYQWNGITILCRGAVLPFYEFRSKERLDDKKWLQMLDSPKRPPLPGWLKEIYSGNKLSKPKLKPID